MNLKGTGLIQDDSKTGYRVKIYYWIKIDDWP